MSWVPLGGLVVAAPLALSDYGNSILVAAAVYVIAGCGLHVLVHWTGQISLSHAAFVGIGAFGTATLNQSHGVALPLALVGGVLAATLAAGIVGLPALRIRGFELAIVTMAAGFAADRWLFLQSWLVGDFQVRNLEERSLFGFDVERPSELAIPVCFVMVVVLFATTRLGRSSLGRGLRVVAADERVAATYGINVGIHKFFGFLYAGACAGAAGAVYCLGHSRGLGTEEFSPALSILLLSMVLVGGTGSVTGSVVAAAGVGALPVVFGGLGRWLGLVAPLGLLLTVWQFQGGLNEQFRTVGDHVMRLSRRTRRDTTSEGEVT